MADKSGLMHLLSPTAAGLLFKYILVIHCQKVFKKIYYMLEISYKLRLRNVFVSSVPEHLIYFKNKLELLRKFS